MAMSKFDRALSKYRDLVAVDSAKARVRIMQLDYKDNFYLLACIAQTYLDESRFEDGSDKMRKEVNHRKWRMAEKYIIKSFTINDDNAESLYTMGEIRKLSRQNDIAIYCFKRVIKLGINNFKARIFTREIFCWRITQ